MDTASFKQGWAMLCRYYDKQERLTDTEMRELYYRQLQELDATIWSAVLDHAMLTLTFFPKISELLACALALYPRGDVEAAQAWEAIDRWVRRYHPHWDPPETDRMPDWMHLGWQLIGGEPGIRRLANLSEFNYEREQMEFFKKYRQHVADIATFPVTGGIALGSGHRSLPPQPDEGARPARQALTRVSDVAALPVRGSADRAVPRVHGAAHRPDGHDQSGSL